jgi:hypothetical protein
VARREEPVYLIVVQDGLQSGSADYRASVLTASGKATVVTDHKTVPTKDLDQHLLKIESDEFNTEKLPEFGQQLAKLVLPADVAAVLKSMPDRHVVVVHDAPASRIPWETLCIDGWSPAVEGGMSRKYIADNLSVAKWLEGRRADKDLNLLLVVNPTQDLPGAQEEGKRIRSLFANQPSVEIDELQGPAANRSALLTAFQSGRYDVVHYAGHAFFDAANPARSGILCHGKEVLSGADLAGLSQLPALVFFNACEAARIRKPVDRKKRDLDVAKRVQRNIGFAEAFLRGGVANYVGTYWPVGDSAAKEFADTFYTALLNGESVGKALLAGRGKVKNLPSVDWADYVHYGSFDFTLKS